MKHLLATSPEVKDELNLVCKTEKSAVANFDDLRSENNPVSASFHSPHFIVFSFFCMRYGSWTSILRCWSTWTVHVSARFSSATVSISFPFKIYPDNFCGWEFSCIFGLDSFLFSIFLTHLHIRFFFSLSSLCSPYTLVSESPIHERDQAGGATYVYLVSLKQFHD